MASTEKMTKMHSPVRLMGNLRSAKRGLVVLIFPLPRFPIKTRPFTGFSRNDPFGSRPEPGTRLITSILLLTPGEVPEGPARGDQDTATLLQSESER